MALNILQVHKKVFLDLLDADNVSPALVVLDGENPRNPSTGDPSVSPPYVLLYFDFRTPSGADEPEKVSKEATSDVLYTVAFCHSVSGSAHGSLAVAGRVRSALLGVFPTVAGRECGPIYFTGGVPTQRDETTGVAVFDKPDTYEFVSLPG